MRKARTIVFLLAAATGVAAHGDGARAESRPCRAMEYERNAYTVCEVDLRKHTVRLYWKRSDGTPYAYLSALPRALEGEAGKLLFATNAGMFDPALKPVGLYVEQGRELVHVSTKSGYGNFHMKPNGVFYVTGDGAAVAETRAFLKQRPRTALATQSGPMLVSAGVIHPGLNPQGTSRNIRNGIGVMNANEVVFAISDEPVTFYEFALLFRDRLKCPDALYLDGSVSSMFVRSLGRDDEHSSIGPIIGVTVPAH